MSKSVDIIAGTGLDHKTNKSRWPDLVQSARFRLDPAISGTTKSDR
jgi:hypothetical protein